MGSLYRRGETSFGGGTVDVPARDPIDDELAHHVEESVDRLVENGWEPNAAQREARRLLGDVDKISRELHRMSSRRRLRRSWLRRLDGLRQDVTAGLRQFRTHPLGSGAAVAVMAIGIGAVTVMFSIVDGVLIRPLPFHQPERLVSVREVVDGQAQRISPAAYLRWRERTGGALEGLSVFDQGDLELSADSGPDVIHATLASHEFFALLGTDLAAGRGFRADEDHPDGDRVVVISHDLWRQRFGADPGLVGTAILLQGQARTVIGVGPEGFDFPGESQAWLPYGQDGPLDHRLWGARFLDAVARIQPGVDLDVARRRMRESLEEAGAPTGVDVMLTPLKTELAGSVEDGLFMLSAAVTLVLLVACGNVGSLLLARALTRRPELALRSALGAGRNRLVSALLAESLVLSSIGGFGGYLLGAWGLRLVVALAPQDLPRAAEVAMNGRAALAAFAAAVTTGLLIGLVPAFRAAAVDAGPALREARSASTSRSGGRLQGGLIVAQVSLTLVLLAAAGLLSRSFLGILTQDPGFESRSLVTAYFGFPRYRYGETRKTAAFYDALVKRLIAAPGIREAAFVRNLPISRRSMTSPVVIQDRVAAGSRSQTQVTGVTAGYFRTMRIPLLRGRLFEDKDLHAAGDTVIISEAFARTFFPDQDPIGRRVRTLFSSDFAEVIGVVGDIRHLSLVDEAPPIFYYLLPRLPAAGATLVARADVDSKIAFATIAEAVREVDPEQPVGRLATMQEMLARSMAGPRFYAYMLAGFATIAIALAMIGVYGVMSGTVQRRQLELGVRMALGADVAAIRYLVVRSVLTLLGVGVLVGLVATAALTRLLRGLLFEVSPTDLPTLATVVALLLVSGLAAAYPPVRRAGRVDPARVLRG